MTATAMGPFFSACSMAWAFLEGRVEKLARRETGVRPAGQVLFCAR